MTNVRILALRWLKSSSSSSRYHLLSPCSTASTTSFRSFHHREQQKGSRTKRVISYAYGHPQDPLSCQTLGEAMYEAANEVPNCTFLSFPHQNDLNVSFKQLKEDCEKLANALSSIGVMKGSKVGIWAVNRYEWVVCQFAAAIMGAILVNVNPGYRERELQYCMNLVQCDTLVFSQSFRSSDYSGILENVSPGLLKSVDTKTAEVKHQSKGLPHLKRLIALNVETEDEQDTAPGNVPRFHDFIDKFRGKEFTCREGITFDDPIAIQFTSGTTGQPKAAMLTHHNIVNNAYFSGKCFLNQLPAPTKICVPNPLYHCFGCVNGVISGLLYRSQVVVPAATAIAKRTLAAIDKFKCNIVYGTPTMFVDILRERDSELRSCHSSPSYESIERCIMSGAPCPPETIARIRSNVFPSCKSVLIPYGCTETSPVITMTPWHAPAEYLASTVGPPIEHSEVKVCDPSTGRTLAIGERGEVRCRGYLVFAGYYNQPDKTREAMDEGGWYKTGDLGVMNHDGYLSITGRIKDMIIRGGENIYPREIEDFLLQSPDVADVNVVGVPDDRMGEEMVAFVVLKTGVQEGEDTVTRIKDFCKGNIAHFKIPKHILFVEDMPRTVTMKVQKHKLKDLAVQKLNIK